MKVTIRGLQRKDYTHKESGNRVKGTTFHVERKDMNVVGGFVESFYVSDTALEKVGCLIPEDKYQGYIGKTAEVEFNSFGKVSYFQFTA